MLIIDNKIYGCYRIIDEYKKDGRIFWLGECIHCKTQAEKAPANFKQLKSPNCCHYRNGNRILPNRIKDKRLSTIFGGMKQRCYNPLDKNYQWYGAKGIRICEEWLNNPELFVEWAYSNGYTPDLTIDRIKSDQDYTPANCRWVTQTINTRRAICEKPITATITMSKREWSKLIGRGVNFIQKLAEREGEEAAKNYIEDWFKIQWSL